MEERRPANEIVSGVLDAIVRSKEAEIATLVKMPCQARSTGPRGIVASTLRRPASEPLRLITEIKRKSPSAGALSCVLTPGERALRYAHAGASMISVLCDGPFFDGGWEHLTLARQALDAANVTVPLLAKEFVLHERQVEEAAACGADAVLLIVRLLDRAKLTALVRAARSARLEPLVEVVTEEELADALAADALVIGVNARDLDTLVMDANRAARVLAAIPADRIPAHFSGLKSADDVRAVARSRAHAALVGEALMRQDDPSALLASFVAAAR